MLSPKRALSTRSGLSFAEFAGCIAALGGGLALGSMYLGVDMRAMVVSVLRQADIVDPEVLGLSSDEEVLVVEEEIKVEPESKTIAIEATNPGDDAVVSESGTSDVDATEPLVTMTDEERQLATRAYWDTLTKLIRAEVAGRSAATTNPQGWQLLDYLTHRRDGHRDAIHALTELTEQGVDERLVVHGQQVKAWHAAGAKLFGRSVHLLTDGPNPELTGPFGQSWQSSATQHRMEEKLVQNKHVAVAGYLDYAYESLGPFRPAVVEALGARR